MIDLFTISSVILNAILAIVTIVQLRVYRHEVKHRLRAWVGSKRNTNGRTIQLIKSIKSISITFHNHGQLPAMNVRIKSYSQDSKPDDNIFETVNDDGFLIDLIPGEDITYQIFLSPDKYQKALANSLYYGIRVTYDIFKNTSQHSRNKNDGFYEIHGHWVKNAPATDKIIVG